MLTRLVSDFTLAVYLHGSRPARQLPKDPTFLLDTQRAYYWAEELEEASFVRVAVKTPLDQHQHLQRVGKHGHWC